MKSLHILLFFVSSVVYGQNYDAITTSKVDKRVEIVSIAFRLAGSAEYSENTFPFYISRINKHYGRFSNHELIHYIKKMRVEKGTGADAAMRMAVHLDQNLKPLLPFTKDFPDERLGDTSAIKFVRLLKSFYTATNSKLFFRENKELYETVAARFQKVSDELDLNWYMRFYGKQPSERFVSLNGLSNGNSNYGVSYTNGKGQKTIYAILGTWELDKEGMAHFSKDAYFPTLLHEFNHSFVDYILHKNSKPFETSSQAIYKVVEEKMRSGGYQSWSTMFNEALVRASVIKYMKDHKYPKEKVDWEVNEQIARGFIWIEDLVAELEQYDTNRKQFPTLESYYPKLQLAYDNFAKNIDIYSQKYLVTGAKFKSFNEFNNGDQNVDPLLQQLTINFDKPFRGSKFIAPGSSGKQFPSFKKMTIADDAKSIILEWTLQPKTQYEFVLLGLSPEQNNINAAKDYIVNFKTR